MRWWEEEEEWDKQGRAELVNHEEEVDHEGSCIFNIHQCTKGFQCSYFSSEILFRRQVREGGHSNTMASLNGWKGRDHQTLMTNVSRGEGQGCWLQV